VLWASAVYTPDPSSFPAWRSPAGAGGNTDRCKEPHRPARHGSPSVREHTPDWSHTGRAKVHPLYGLSSCALPGQMTRYLDQMTCGSRQDLDGGGLSE